MKKRFMVGMIILLSYNTLLACEICGGGGNYNPFLFPHLSRNYVGLSYMSRSFHTHMDDGSSAHTQFHTTLLHAQWAVSNRLQLMMTLPYQNLSWSGMGEISRKRGLGDITLMAHYKLFDLNTTKLRQTFYGGVGVKLATGHYTAVKEQMADANFQTGTGATDVQLNAAYRMGYQRWIFQLTGNYQIRTTNREGYRYGNVSSGGATVAYNYGRNGFSIAPYLQLSAEKLGRDKDHGTIQEETGTSGWFTGAGLDISTRYGTIGASYQTGLHGIGQGVFNDNPRLTARMVFSL